MTVPQRRATRWASPEVDALQSRVCDIDGTVLPPIVQTIMTAEQVDAYVAHFRIREITNKLQLPDMHLKAHTRPREPSPDPEYDTAGRRTNTRVQRHRRALEMERHRLIEDISAVIPSYKAPHDYRRPTRFAERLYIPQTDFPGINFIGQILGPRGSSLKEIQKASGAVISIRGKGSVKEGRGRATTRASDDAPLHVVVMADTQLKAENGKKRVQKVIDDAVTTPEWQNEHKKTQLRDLAKINGTFRDDEGRHHQLGQNQSSINPRPIRDVASGSQLKSPNHGVHADTDFDREYEQLMQDVNGDGITNEVSGTGQQFNPLPPWRADRLRQQGHY